jgi:hypothetical protein
MYPGMDSFTVHFQKSQVSVVPQYKPPVQSVLTVYISSNVFLKCSACCFPTYLTPKSSTMSVNVIGLVLCFHSPCVVGVGAYPCLASRSFKRSLASFSACGRPYTPPLTSMYTPSLWVSSWRLYCCIIPSGMSEICSLMYSYFSIGVPR